MKPHTHIAFLLSVAATMSAADAFAVEGYAVSRANWENGFDTKLTSISADEGPDVTSPTLMLSAQWNYKFPSSTFVGGTISSLAQPQTERTAETVSSYAMYYGGLNVAQGVLDVRPFRLVFTVSAGKGVFYARTDLPDGRQTFADGDFNYVEPGVFATFYQWDSLEFGAVVSNRIVRLEDAYEAADDGDLSTLSYGLTFRSQRR